MGEVPLYFAGRRWEQLYNRVTCEQSSGSSVLSLLTPAAYTTRWSMQISLLQRFEGSVTKFAPHKAPKSFASGMFTFD